MLLYDHAPPRLPAEIADRLACRLPVDGDVDAVVDLLVADVHRHTPNGSVDAADVRSRLVGLKSWSRRQVVVVPVTSDGTPSLDRAPVAWISLEDRAVGLTPVQWAIAAGAPQRDELAAALLTWAEEVGGSFARHRGELSTQLDADANESDRDRGRILSANNYRMVRTWLHMRRAVHADEASWASDESGAVRVRPVHRHTSGLPVAKDVRTVHRMLEESFADHFNSYRESFAEFVQRLTESPEKATWDHWWIAEIEWEGTWQPAGGLVTATLPARGDRGEGTYMEYLGVHQSARGRGVAKALIRAAIADAASRGRTHVDLEVDADSPTQADGLYTSLRWETFERTQSWHHIVNAQPSRLLETPAE